MKKIITCLLFSLLYVSQVFAIDGVGYFCASYDEALFKSSHYSIWKLSGCQKVTYDSNGTATGVTSDPAIDIVLEQCFFEGHGSSGCDQIITDKKKYPYYYSYMQWGGAASGDGAVLYDARVLNHPTQSEGTLINKFNVCMHDGMYGVRSCDKMP